MKKAAALALFSLLPAVAGCSGCSVLRALPHAPSDDETEAAACIELTNAEAQSALFVGSDPYTTPAHDYETLKGFRVRLDRATPRCKATANWLFASLMVDHLEAKTVCGMGYRTEGIKLLSAEEMRAQRVLGILAADSRFRSLIGVVLEAIPAIKDHCGDPPRRPQVREPGHDA